VSFGGAALGSASGTIDIGLGDSLRNLRSVSDALNGVDRSSRNVGASFGTVGRGAGLLGGAILGGLGLGINAAAAFEQQMSGVQSVTGATGDEFAALSELALQLGRDTSFGATESAAAIEELAKAGVTTTDILNGAAQGAVDFAAAAGVAVPDAAIIIANAMNIFSLSGGDAAHIADVFAAGANKSAASAGDLAMAMAQGGQVAAQFGFTFEETVGILALFADAGLKGSDAGTSLKTAILALGAPTDAAAAEMEKYGIVVRDSTGEMLPAAEIAQVLQDKLGGLGAAERDAALKTIFGNDAIRAGIILMGAGAEGVTDYTNAVNDQGAAHDAARIRLDNFRGSLEQFKGSLETAAIIVGGVFLPALRELVDGATRLVNIFLDLPGPLQTAVAVIAAAVGGVFSLAGAFALAGPAMLRFVQALRVIAPLMLGISAPILIVVGALAALGIAYRTNFLGFADAVGRVKKQVSRDFRTIVAGFRYFRRSGLDPVAAGVGALSAVFPGLATEIRAVGRVVDGVVGFFRSARDMAVSMREAFGVNGLSGVLAILATRLNEAFGAGPTRVVIETLQRMGEGVALFGQNVRAMVDGVGLLIRGEWSDAWALLRERATETAGFLRGVFDDIPWGTIGAGLLAGLQGALSFLAGWVLTIGAPIVVAWATDLWVWVRDEGLPEFFDLVGDLTTWVLNLGEPLPGTVADLSAWILARIRDVPLIIRGFGSWILEIGEPLPGAVRSLGAWIGERLRSVTHTVLDFTAWVLDVGLPQPGTVADIQAWIGARLREFTHTVANFTGWVLDLGKPLPGTVTDIGAWILGRLQDVPLIVSNFTTWILDLGKPLPGRIADLGSWILDRIKQVPPAVDDFTDWVLGIGLPTSGQIANLDAWLGDLIGKIGTTVSNFVDWALNVGIPATITFVDDITQGIQDAIQGQITEINLTLDQTDFGAINLPTEAPETFNQAGRDTANLLATAVGGAIKGVFSLGLGVGGSSLWTTTLDALNEFAEGFWNELGRILLERPPTGLVSGIGGLGDEIVGGGQNIFEVITQPFKDAADWLLDFTLDFPGISTLANAVQGSADLIKASIQGIIDLWGLLPSWLGGPNDTPAAGGTADTGRLATVLSPKDLTALGETDELARALRGQTAQVEAEAQAFGNIVSAAYSKNLRAALDRIVGEAKGFDLAGKLSAALSGGGLAEAASHDAKGGGGGAAEAILAPFRGLPAQLTAIGAEAGSAFRESLARGLTLAQTQVGLAATQMATRLGLFAIQTALAGQNAGETFRAALTAGLGLSRAEVSRAADQMATRLSLFAVQTALAGRTAGNTFRDGIAAGMANAVTAAAAALAQIAARVSGFSLYGEGAAIGRSLGQGIAAGIQGQIGATANAAAALVSGTLNAARSAAAIGSPSKLFAREIGLPIAQGVALGISDGQRTAFMAMERLIGNTAGAGMEPNLVAMRARGAGAGAGGGNTYTYTITIPNARITNEEEADSLATRILTTIVQAKGPTLGRASA
jgi:TP901 family phage tail tape measure protein